MGKLKRMSSYKYSCIIQIETKESRVKKMFVGYTRHTLGFEPCVGADDNVYLKLEND